MQTIAAILDQLDQTREKLLVAIAALPDEALTTAAVVGEWSIADLLVNLTVWEAELVTGMMRLQQGKKPGKLLAALADRAAFDEANFAANRGRDLNRIFDDLMQVRLQLEEWLETFSEQDLTNPNRYRWFQGKSLQTVIADCSYAHEAQFIPALEKFAKQWAGRTDLGLLEL